MMPLSVLCLVALVLLGTVLHRRRTLRCLYLVSKIRGPSIRELVMLHRKKLTQILKHFCEQSERYSYEPWGFWTMTGDYVVVLSSLGDITDMYQSKNLTTKPDFLYSSVAHYVGKGSLFLRGGEEHRLRRKVFGPAFHKSVLELNFDIISNGAEHILQEFRKFADGPSLNIAKIIDNTFAHTVIRFLTADRYYVSDVTEITDSLAQASMLALLKMVNPAKHWYRTKVHQRTQKAESEVRKTFAKFKTVFKNYYDKMVAEITSEADKDPRDVFESSVKYSSKAGIVFGDKEITDEGLTLMAAAIDTTKTTIKMTLLVLALHQEEQQRVFDELSDIFGNSDRRPTPQDLDRMQYLSMVIKETLRLFPSGPLIAKKALEETNLNGTIIPKGTCVMANIMMLHRNPNYFKNPMEFIPERFVPELSESRHPYSYIPFSSGVRKCPGQAMAFMMMKHFLSSILRCYKIFPAEGMNGLDDVEVLFNITLHVPKSVVKLVSRK